MLRDNAQESNRLWISILLALGLVAAVLWVWDPTGAGSMDSVTENPATVGDALETNRGVVVQLQAVDENPVLPDSFLLGDPLGRFVAVQFRITNDSDEPLTIYRRTVSAVIESRAYDADSLFSVDESAELLRKINPGLSGGFVAYFDIPPGERLTGVEFDSPGFGDSLEGSH